MKKDGIAEVMAGYCIAIAALKTIADISAENEWADSDTVNLALATGLAKGVLSVIEDEEEDDE